MNAQTIERVPLSKLALSDRNVRTNVVDATDVEDLVGSIKAHGLLSPLVVIPAKKGSYAVIAGGRRYRALLEIHGAEDVEVPVIVADSDAAEEVSLAENFIRKAMRPYEIYRAFAALGGGDAGVLAERFGMAKSRAQKILRLGNLHPDVFEAYSLGQLTDEQAQAFAATASHELQEQAWAAFRQTSNHWDREPRAIHRLLGLGDWDTKRRLVGVGKDAYLAAGGRLEEDLFSDEVRVVDLEILATLELEQAKALQQAYLARTSRPVTLLDTRPEDWKDYQRIEYGPLSDELTAELEALEERLEATDYDDREEVDRIDRAMDVLNGKRPILIPDEGEYGLFVRDGHPELWRLDMVEEAKIEEGETPAPEGPKPPSAAAMERMAVIRHQRLIDRSKQDLMFQSAAVRILVFMTARKCFMGALTSDTRGWTSVAGPQWHSEGWMQGDDLGAAFDEFATVDINGLAAEMLANMTVAKTANEKSSYIDWLASWSKPWGWQSTEDFWTMFNKKQIFAMLGDVCPSFERIYSNSKLDEIRRKAHDICTGNVDFKISPIDKGEVEAAQRWVPAWLRFADE